MNDVYITGIGQTKIGELWERSFLDLAVEAAKKALKDAEKTPEDIGAVFVGTMLSGELNHQSHVGAYIAAKLNIQTAAVRVEAACASGGMAFVQGVQAAQTMKQTAVLVLGVEKMTDYPAGYITGALAQAADTEVEGMAGLTFPGLYAILARAHMDTFGTTAEQLAAVAVKNHLNACKNPHAQYRKEISITSVLHAPRVAEPLGLLDCSPISDGAAALVLEASTQPSKRHIAVAGIGVGIDSVALVERASLTELAATRRAAEQAYAQAGSTADDIDIAEVHDCFTIAEILAIEDLGFVAKGEGGMAIADGYTAHTGTLPVNLSGGLKASGHPVGATGVKQLCEITMQLRGEAEARQRKNVRTALAHNVGGSGGTAVVSILRNSHI